MIPWVDRFLHKPQCVRHCSLVPIPEGQRPAQPMPMGVQPRVDMAHSSTAERHEVAASGVTNASRARSLPFQSQLTRALRCFFGLDVCVRGSGAVSRFGLVVRCAGFGTGWDANGVCAVRAWQTVAQQGSTGTGRRTVGPFRSSGLCTADGQGWLRWDGIGWPDGGAGRAPGRGMNQVRRIKWVRLQLV